MNLRNIALLGLLALVAGCADEPVSHHGTDQKVFNIVAAGDAATTVLNRHFNGKIVSDRKDGDVRIITSGYNEKIEMNERWRWQAVVTITPIDDTNANIEVEVMQQRDESDTGYGERSPSNPKWGIETHNQDSEHEIIRDIEHELSEAQRKKR